MPVQDILSETITGNGVKLPVSSLLSITGSIHPAYLVITALDRGNYPAGNPGSVGSFLGNGAKLPLTAQSGDIRSAGIVFTWTGGQYANAIYGSLASLSYISSPASGDVTNLSVFTTSSLSIATQDAGNPLTMLRADPAGYSGSTTLLTSMNPAKAVPQYTPGNLAACALGFVGLAWNNQGCWNLASTIAAESGAGLPLSATALGVAGQGNGEWVVVYNGPAHSSLVWQTLVAQGDAVVFGTPGGGGHITLCVSGAGATAMLVDNITFQNAQGQIANAAHDGAPNDVLIAPPHPANQEWAGVQPNSVVIYALDTPVITDRFAVAALSLSSMTGVASLVSVSDPAGKAAIRFQAYETGAATSLLLHGQPVAASSIANSVTAASLAAFSIETGAHSGSGLLEVRAFNGSYWGDWQSVSLQAGAPGGASSPNSLADWLHPPAATLPTSSYSQASPAFVTTSGFTIFERPSPTLNLHYRH